MTSRNETPVARATREQLNADFLIGPAKRPRKSDEQPCWLTANNIADRLQLSVRQVRRWIQSGELPSHKFGRSTRIDERDFAIFVLERKHRT